MPVNLLTNGTNFVNPHQQSFSTQPVATGHVMRLKEISFRTHVYGVPKAISLGLYGFRNIVYVLANSYKQKLRIS